MIFVPGICTLAGKCQCAVGYTGQHCEHDLNECWTGSHQCNTAISSCFNTFGGYKCNCKPGYVLKQGHFSFFIALIIIFNIIQVFIISPVELPYIFCKNLSDFTSKILEDNTLFLQVSWKILEENVQEMSDLPESDRLV